MQVSCEGCGCAFYMPPDVDIPKHPKCFYCRAGISPDASRGIHSMDWCLEKTSKKNTKKNSIFPEPECILAVSSPIYESW